MKKETIRLLTCLLLTLSFSVANSAIILAQEAASMEDARVYGDNSLIRSLLIICDSDVMKYSLVGSSPDGISFIEINASEKIINHEECNGSRDCSFSGALGLTGIPSQVVTAIVSDIKGNVHVEKIKINSAGGAKVYFIGSMPGLGGVPVAMGTLSDPATSVQPGTYVPPTEIGPNGNETSIETIDAVPAAGPELVIDVKQNKDNDYLVSISSFDPEGVDFIEILENGTFLDVQICGKKPTCTYDKKLIGRKPGRNKYLVKSMNARGALTFKEELIYFTD